MRQYDFYFKQLEGYFYEEYEDVREWDDPRDDKYFEQQERIFEDRRKMSPSVLSTRNRALIDENESNDSISNQLNEAEEDNHQHLEEDYCDYDNDYDVPPGYMDECPEDRDPDTWREFYTGG